MFEDFLKNLSAFKNEVDKEKDFSNTSAEDENERSTEESIKIAQKAIQEKDNEEENSEIDNVIKDIANKKEEEEKEDGLANKIKDIEKVLTAFSDKPITSSKSSASNLNTGIQLNKPIDFSSVVAKGYVNPYIQQPTSQSDRIGLLYENLKKQNLI